MNEFARVGRMLYPRLVWEHLTTEAGKRYLLIHQGDDASWFVEPMPALGPVEACWAVIAGHRGDSVLDTGRTPAGALEGATAKLVDLMERAAASAAHGELASLTTDRQMEGVL